jgi:hypothetical protein
VRRIVAQVLVRWRPKSPPAIPDSSAPPTDGEALSAALSATGEERLTRLWEFVALYPDSPLRKDAYLALLDGGAAPIAVCDHARRAHPELLEPGSSLAERCATP